MESQQSYLTPGTLVQVALPIRCFIIPLSVERLIPSIQLRFLFYWIFFLDSCCFNLQQALNILFSEHTFHNDLLVDELLPCILWNP